MIRVNLVAIYSLIFFSIPSFSQSNKPDTLFITRAINNTRELYFKETKAQSNFNNGSDFAEHHQLGEEFPYFLTDDWITGSITYDNDLYESVPLMYDISQQKVITEHFLSANKMALVNKKIQQFTILKHTFIWLENFVPDQTGMKVGFYDLLYNGKIKVLARYEKQIQQRVVSNQLEATFQEITRYYIYKNGKYFQVKSKGSVFNLFADQKSTLRQFVKKNNISFRSDRAQAMVKIAEYYDSLIN